MMKKKHKNAVKVEIPEYQTIREIVLEGTARGGDNKQFMFLDRKKQLQELNFNQTFYRIRTLSTYFYSKGLKNSKKIAIVSENLIEWGFAYYAIIVGGNVCVPMDAKLSYEENLEQIKTSKKIIEDIIKDETKFFQAPAGSFGEGTMKAANELGYTSIKWDVDTIDWNNRKEPEVIIQRVSKKEIKDGSIVLMHPTYATTQCLDDIIQIIRDRGLKPGMLSDIF